MASLWAEFIAAGLLITYLYASVVGIQALETNLDPKMLLPANSQSTEGIRIMSDVVSILELVQWLGRITIYFNYIPDP